MRAWHELVATIGDHIFGGVPVLGLILFAITGLVALFWYWWPEWWHALRRFTMARFAGGREESRGRRWRFRGLLGRLRARWRFGRRKRRGEPADTEPEPELGPDDLPDLPAVELALSADQLAAQGRYKEAVRERLRAIVRELIERQVVDHRPGWTVTELATMAAQNRLATAAPLAAASELFSSIWYGQRDATPAHDAAMRVHADQVRAVLSEQVPA
ncbi:MAG TPA: DUF4129 domain-containing protein [Natronosporangium sp.]